MTFWVEDLAALYVLGTPGAATAVFGAESVVVLWDSESDVRIGADGNERVVLQRTIRYRAATLTSLAVGSAITVDGTAYKVRDVQTLAEGNEKRAIVVPAAA